MEIDRKFVIARVHGLTVLFIIFAVELPRDACHEQSLFIGGKGWFSHGAVKSVMHCIYQISTRDLFS